eukprot:5161335-Amphidinium_carterae.6
MGATSRSWEVHRPGALAPAVEGPCESPADVAHAICAVCEDLAPPSLANPDNMCGTMHRSADGPRSDYEMQSCAASATGLANLLGQSVH